MGKYNETSVIYYNNSSFCISILLLNWIIHTDDDTAECTVFNNVHQFYFDFHGIYKIKVSVIDHVCVIDTDSLSVSLHHQYFTNSIWSDSVNQY